MSGFEELLIVAVLLLCGALSLLPLMLSIIALVRSGRIGELEREVRGLSVGLFQARNEVQALWQAQRVQEAAVPADEPPTTPAGATPERPRPPAPTPTPTPTPAPASTPPTVSAADTGRSVAPMVAQIAGRAPAGDPSPPMATAEPDSPTAEPRPRRSLEDLLGRQLFLKAGVVIVVIGVVLFLAFTLAHLGAAGKVASGYGAGAVMLALGLLAERREAYRTFGRGLLAGAWATIYFVTFAAHFIPAAQIIGSQNVALVALLVAAAAAVGFSLRYRNEWTTVFAFLLIYLTLGISAWMHLASFNLLATAVGAGAIAVLAWHRGWLRLLALGSLATWVTLALWLVPQLEVWSAAERTAALWPVIGALLLTWLLLLVAVVEGRGRPGGAWAVSAFLANLIGVFGLLTYAVQRVQPDDTWLVAAGLGLAYLGVAWRLGRRGRDLLFRLSPIVGLAALGAAGPLHLGLGHGWVPIWLMFVAQLALVGGVVLREATFRIAAYAALAAVLSGMAAAHLGLAPFPADWTMGPFRSPVLLAAALLCLIDSALMRGPWQASLADGERQVAPVVLAGIGTVLLLPPIAWEVPRMWVAPAMAAIAVLWALIGRRRSFRDLLVEAALLAPAAVVVLSVLNLSPPAGTPEGIRPLSVGLTLALLYAAYSLIVSPAATRGAGASSLSTGERAIAVLYSVLGGVGLVLLVWHDVPEPWVAPTLAVAVLVHLELARRFGLPELLAEGALLALTAGVALAAVSWDLAGTSLALPARVVSVALTSALLYGAALLVGRIRADAASARAVADHVEGAARQIASPPLLGGLALGMLAIPTVAVAMLVRDEAALRGLEDWVALAWGALGLVYLAVSIARSSRVWGLYGAAMMVVATLHLWAVNLGMSDPQDPWWARSGLVAALVLQLALAYRLLKLAGRRAGDALAAGVLRVCAIWLGAISVGWSLLVELSDIWTGAGWAALALALLGAHLVTGKERWQWPALAAGVAAVGWCLVADVILWERTLDDWPNSAALPLACAGMLLGYGVQRILELRRGDADPGLVPSIPRLIWLAGFAALLTGYIAIQAEGTALTVWLSIEGMVLVALGFLMRERLARVAGLALLSGCILKLFVYDLRGLTGVPRILSFVVLGLVLIAVSFVYTRFRARLAEYL